MDGLGRAIGAGIDVTLAGRTYLIGPLTLWDLGTCEQHLLAQRRTPVECVVSFLEQADPGAGETRELIDRARQDTRADRYSRMVDSKDFFAWFDSAAGLSFTAWLCLRKHTPGFSCREAVGRLIDRATPEEIREFIRRRDLVGCFDLRAAGDWREPEGDEDEPGAERKPYPWRRMLREMMTAYPGVTLTDLAQLTWYQFRALRVSEEQLGGPGKLSWDEYKAQKKARQQQKAQELV